MTHRYRSTRTESSARPVERMLVVAGVISALAVPGACRPSRPGYEGPGSGASAKTESDPDLAFTGSRKFRFERTLPPTGNDLYTVTAEVTNKGTAAVPAVKAAAYSKGPRAQR